MKFYNLETKTTSPFTNSSTKTTKSTTLFFTTTEFVTTPVTVSPLSSKATTKPTTKSAGQSSSCPCQPKLIKHDKICHDFTSTIWSDQTTNEVFSRVATVSDFKSSESLCKIIGFWSRASVNRAKVLGKGYKCEVRDEKTALSGLAVKTTLCNHRQAHYAMMCLACPSG